VFVFICCVIVCGSGRVEAIQECRRSGRLGAGFAARVITRGRFQRRSVRNEWQNAAVMAPYSDSAADGVELVAKR
jgi:hypothetical protein